MHPAFSGSFSNHMKMIAIVMAGLRPGHPRYLANCSQDVDGQHKAGQDELRD
jgi:hypothetical protein